MWNRIGSSYYHADSASVQDHLDKAVYLLKMDRNDELFLERVKDNFSFSFKIYGKDDAFISFVYDYHVNNKQQNLGVLLAGEKGTGKTVTGQLLAEKINLPIILVTVAYDGVAEFIANIHQNVIIYIDEFDKVFNNAEPKKQEKILSLMDGTLSNVPKIYILTVNDININPHLISRPGRIRFKKVYKALEAEIINELVDDLLVYKKWRQDIITFFEKVATLSIDVVKCVITEVNLRNAPPESFSKWLNIEFLPQVYNIYKSDKPDRLVAKLMHAGVRLNPNPAKFAEKLSEDGSAPYIHYGDGYLGRLQAYDELDGMATVTTTEEDENENEVRKTVYFWFEATQTTRKVL